MFSYQFDPINSFTLLISVISVLGFYMSIVLAWWLDRKESPAWLSRKIIHTGIGTIIAFILVIFDNLSGPLLTLGLFFVPLLIGRIRYKPLFQLVSLAKRENGDRIATLSAGLSAIIVYTAIFVILPERPEVFVSAILAVSWGDGAGELIGRPFGRHSYTVLENEKSIEGSIAVGLFSFLSFIIAIIGFTNYHLFSIIPFLFVVSLVIVIIEALSPRWSDNLFIPLATSLLLYLIPV